MSIVKHSLWGNSLLSDFFDDERLLSSSRAGAVNLKETEKSYDVEIAAPGFEKKDFNVSLDNGLLTVAAEKRTENEKKDEKYTHREFGYSSFSRSFNLPSNTNQENIDAHYAEGILKLSIAKTGATNGQRKKAIEIQ
jgi:HSP20 family protein